MNDDLYKNAIPLHEDAQTLIDAIRNLLEDSNCIIDPEREIILLHTIAEIEATALNGGTLPGHMVLLSRAFPT
jgi:hypothetical protein